MPSRRGSAELRAAAALLAALCLLAVGGCGGSGESGGDTTVAVTTAQSTGAEPGSPDAGRQGEGGTSDRGQSRDDQDQGDGSQPDGSTGSGDSGAGSVSGNEFASELRTIVGEAFVELRSLVAPAMAMTDPDAYADELEAGVGEIGDTIDQLQALEAAAGAEEGTERVIAAFTALRGWVAAGAEDYASGDRKRTVDGLAGLREGAAQFRAEMGKAIASLRRAGYGLPGS